MGCRWIADRRQFRGRLDEAGQHRGFAKVHITGRFVEIAPRGGLDAKSIRAEEHAVEVHRKDLVLGVGVLQPEGEQHLLNLALHRPVG